MYLPTDVEYIINKFYENNYEAFIVGGCVRDTLLNRPLNDYDITTNATPEATQSLFNKTIPTGIKHGTITVILNKESYEVTTYRIDGEYKDNRRPDEVKFVTNIKEDLARRDFTINALAYSPYYGFKDFFNGQEDLKAKIIRAVGNPNKRFEEDALRMLRAIRFSSQLNFEIEKNTLEAITTNSKLIKNVSYERILVELEKTLMSKIPSNGLEEMYKTKLLKNIFPSFYEKYFDENMYLNSITIIKDLESHLPIRLFFFIINTFKNISQEDIKKVLKILRLDNKSIDEILIYFSNRLSYQNINSKFDLKILMSKIEPPILEHLFKYNFIIDIEKQSKIEKLQTLVHEILENKEPLKIKDLAITGNDILRETNIKAGKELGVILSELHQIILETPKLNDANILLDILKNKG